MESEHRNACHLDFTLLIEAASLIRNVEAQRFEVFHNRRNGPRHEYPESPYRRFLVSFEFQCLTTLLSSVITYDRISVPTSDEYFARLGRRYDQLLSKAREKGRGYESFRSGLREEGHVVDTDAFELLKDSVQGLDPLFDDGCVERVRVSTTEAETLDEAFAQQLRAEGGRTLAALASEWHHIPWYEQVRSLSHKSLPYYPGGVPFTDGMEFDLYFAGQDLHENWLRTDVGQTDDDLRLHGGSQFFRRDKGQGIVDTVFFFMRGLFYNEIAKLNRMPYMTHPLRMPVVLGDVGGEQPFSAGWAHAVTTWARDTRNAIVQARNRDIGCDVYALDLPPFVDIILRTSSDRAAIMETCLKLRRSPPAVELRAWIAHVSAEIRENRGNAVERATEQLRGLRRWLYKETGVEDMGMDVSLKVISYRYRLPPWLATRITVFDPTHVQFLYDCVKRSQSMLALEPEIERLFGPGTAPYR